MTRDAASQDASATKPATDHVTRDAFLGGAIHVLQPKAGYRAGLDAVLLAAACPVGAGVGGSVGGDSVLDCGAGVGTAALCIAARVPSARLTLVEREPELAALARDNIAANGCAARATVIAADLTGRLAQSPELAGLTESFDHVIANPPYYENQRGTLADDPQRAAAHAMPAGGLEAWARFMAAMAKPRGTVTLVHRADALADVLGVLDGRFGALKIRPVHARATEPATRILVHGIKGSRAPLVLLPALVLYDAGGGTRAEVEAMLRGGAALEW